MNATKLLILKAARRVLIKEGSSGFSMRKVASEAAITLSNVQYHYKTRDDLLDGLLESYIEDFRRLISTYSEQSTSGQDNLRHLIQNILREQAENDEIRFSLAITSFAEQSEVNNHLNDFYEEFYTLVANFLGQLTGKPNYSPGITRGASVLVPFINGYGVASKSLGLDSDELAQELTEIVWLIIHRND